MTPREKDRYPKSVACPGQSRAGATEKLLKPNRCSREAVNRALPAKAADAGSSKTCPQQQHRLTDDEQVKLVAAYQAGNAVQELAEKFRTSRQTVSAVLSRHGVLRQRRTLSDDEISTAAQLYKDGWSLAKIGKRFEMDAGTIHDALRKVGVAMRRVGTSQWK